jgi:hypothetical protein
MSNQNVVLHIKVDNVLQFSINNPATKPFIGECIGTPPSLRRKLGYKEVYVGNIVNQYPETTDENAPTIIECQCVAM